jgi:hypothetical protein
MSRLLTPLALLPAFLLTSAGQDWPVQPGQWRTTLTITDLQMQGAPAFVVAMMKKKPTVVSSCITPEQAKAGPRAAMAADKSCTISGYKVTASTWAWTRTCTQGGQTTSGTAAGTWTPTGYAGAGTMTGSGSVPMTMRYRIAGTRTGGC